MQHNLCWLSSLILRLAVTVRQHAAPPSQRSQSVCVSCQLYFIDKFIIIYYYFTHKHFVNKFFKKRREKK